LKIIKCAEALRSNYIPNELLFRDDLIKKIQNKVSLGTGNLLLVGDTGIGKTISVKKALIPYDKKIIFVEINCSNDNSYISIAKRIIESIKKTNYSDTGKSRSQLAEELIKILKTKREKKIIIFFDEIDKLIDKERDHQEVLIPIIENTNSNIIFVSNKDQAFDKLDTRIKSRLQIQQEKVRRYNREEIYQILLDRSKKSFNDETYDLDVLNQIAEIYFHTTGDIRDALNVLFQIGELAEEKGERITIKLLDEAQKRANEKEFLDVYETLTDHQKVIILGVSKLSSEGLKGYVEVKSLYNFYEKTAKNHRNNGGRNIGDPVGFRQFESFLKKLILTGLIRIELRTLGKQGRQSLIFPTFDAKKVMDEYYN